MNSFTALACLLLAGVACATHIELKGTDGKVCLVADLTVSLNIKYPSGMTTKSADVKPADSAITVGGVCGKSLMLAIKGGSVTHNLTLTFSQAADTATLDNIEFQYSLEDAAVFPDANLTSGSERVASKAVKQTLSKTSTYFHCSSYDTPLDVTGHDSEAVAFAAAPIKIQAFGVGDSGYTGNGELCAKDVSTTVAPPPTTTAAPITTTVAPKDNKFVLMNENGTVCTVLVAKVFNVSLTNCGGLDDNFPVISEGAVVTGDCGATLDRMIITATYDKLQYELTLNYTKPTGTTSYGLDGVVATVGALCHGMKEKVGEMKAPAANYYKCDAEQRIVAENVTLIMSGVKLQAFRSDGNSTELKGDAYICMADSNVSNIVPIAVGCALAGLIVIVLIAYIIGRLRRRPYEPV